MKRMLFALVSVLPLAAPAAAQDCAALIKAAESAAAEAPAGSAVPKFREAIEKCPPTRERVAAYHAFAAYQLRGNDLSGAEATIEAARAFIVEKFGADDLAMAGNRTIHGYARLRRNDREGARDAFAVAARIRNAKVDAWDESEGPMGAVGHKPSGLKLPPRAASLEQFRRDINNDDGTDVSVGYRAQRSGAVSVTLYIYRPEGEFGAVFAQEIRTIRNFNPQAILHREEAQTLETKAGKIEGRLARFEYAGRGGVYGTRLYIFPLKRDAVKLRVTFLQADEAFVDTQVAALLGAVAWPAQ
jgi:hypothetical protein